MLTLEEHMRTLAELRDEAKVDRQFGAAITAETNRGKVAGLYIEKREISGPGGKDLFSPEQVVKMAEEIKANKK